MIRRPLVLALALALLPSAGAHAEDLMQAYELARAGDPQLAIAESNRLISKEGAVQARAALEQGHRVSLFLAGDAVQLIREDVLSSLNGLGTGNLRELYDGIVADGGRFYLSGGSSKARGVTAGDIAGKPAEFAGPPKLVELSLDHERMFTY